MTKWNSWDRSKFLRVHVNLNDLKHTNELTGLDFDQFDENEILRLADEAFWWYFKDWIPWNWIRTVIVLKEIVMKTVSFTGFISCFCLPFFPHSLHDWTTLWIFWLRINFFNKICVVNLLKKSNETQKSLGNLKLFSNKSQTNLKQISKISNKSLFYSKWLLMMYIRFISIRCHHFWWTKRF